MEIRQGQRVPVPRQMGYQHEAEQHDTPTDNEVFTRAAVSVPRTASVQSGLINLDLDMK